MTTLSSIISGRFKGIQRGSFTFGNGGTGTVTITSVDTTKSYLLLSQANGYASDTTDKSSAVLVNAYLSNGTTITWAANNYPYNNGTGTGTCYWQVIEYL